jgi:hypothetical protein
MTDASDYEDITVAEVVKRANDNWRSMFGSRFAIRGWLRATEWASFLEDMDQQSDVLVAPGRDVYSALRRAGAPVLLGGGTPYSGITTIWCSVSASKLRVPGVHSTLHRIRQLCYSTKSDTSKVYHATIPEVRRELAVVEHCGGDAGVSAHRYLDESSAAMVFRDPSHYHGLIETAEVLVESFEGWPQSDSPEVVTPIAWANTLLEMIRKRWETFVALRDVIESNSQQESVN